MRLASTGEQIGVHRGLLGVTIGQRHGLGVMGGERLYTVRLDVDRATLWVGPREAGLSAGLCASEGNALAPREVLEGPGVCVRVRYRQDPVPCSVRILPGRWEVRFENPEWAVAPGQSAVFYLGGRMLGGARIDSSIPFTRL